VSLVIEKRRQRERWAEEVAAETEMAEERGKCYGITTWLLH